ncbi:hypothetical protein SDC9_58453 [bioreactor metagenome]|uniref:Uncharacterized protein n=1 Tax=bioreactor metagenome TaxID=1076179 RepID=A0A644X7F7_9ZZZZ
MGRIGEARGGAGRHDLAPGAVVLGPERGAPDTVQLLEGAVAELQPCPERRRGLLVEALRHVTAVLVPHVPHRQRRM